MCKTEKEFVDKIRELVNKSQQVLLDFKATRYADRQEKIKGGEEFTEVSVFSAKLYVFLFKSLSVCHVELPDDDDMYPEFKEDHGKDIIKIFIASGKEFLSNIIQKIPKSYPVFWKSFESFKRFAEESKEYYNADLEDPGISIRSLQQMTVYILVMCLYGGQANQSCFSYAPACWLDLFYSLYYAKFFKLGGWNLWERSREVSAAIIPQDLNKMDWTTIRPKGFELCKEILSSSTLTKLAQNIHSLIETENSEGGQGSDYCVENLKIMYLTLRNSAANRAKAGHLTYRFPFPSHRLWNEYGSEYINLLIFSRHLMKRLFKMVGLSSDDESQMSKDEIEDELDKSLQDSIESVSKATVLMSLYKTCDDKTISSSTQEGSQSLVLLLNKFREKWRFFKDQSDIRNGLWLFIADACESKFVETTTLCLKVLQMIVFVFEMATTYLTKNIYNCTDKIWAKVFVLKYGRKYSLNGGWMTFIRDALPTIRIYTQHFHQYQDNFLSMIKANNWTEIFKFFCTTHGSISIPSSIQEISTPAIESVDIVDSSNDAARSSPSTSKAKREFQEHSEVIEVDQSGRFEELDSRNPELTSHQNSLGKKTIQVVLSKLSEEILAQYGQSLEGPSSDSSLDSTSEASKECLDESDRDIDGATTPKKSKVENISSKSPKSATKIKASSRNLSEELKSMSGRKACAKELESEMFSSKSRSEIQSTSKNPSEVFPKESAFESGTNIEISPRKKLERGMFILKQKDDSTISKSSKSFQVENETSPEKADKVGEDSKVQRKTPSKRKGP